MPGAGRSSSLARLTVADLQRELSRRQRSGKALLRKRARLAAKLTDLDNRITELGLSPSSNGHTIRKRPRNEMSLADALAKALHGKTMSISEAMVAVQNSGYRSSAANFRNVVSIALNTSGKFKRVERGQYTAK